MRWSLLFWFEIGDAISTDDITLVIEELDDTLEMSKSVIQSLNSSFVTPATNYSDNLKSGKGYALDFRWSGKLEC